MDGWIFDNLLLADWFTGMMSDLDAKQRFALLIVGIACGTGVICTVVVFVSSTLVSFHRRRLEAQMKREMIERGMSADEIVKIIEAAPPLEDGSQRWMASWGAAKKS
jgi:hypothetical protein